jgi:hypothetical protein
MKHKPLQEIGKFLMKLNNVDICIVDDEDIYFNKLTMPPMITTSNNDSLIEAFLVK